MTCGIGRLGDLKAVVVGGAGGIGRAITQRFAREGAQVAVVDADRVCMDELTHAGIFGANPLCLEADITQSEAVQRVAQQLTSEWGSIDILVNSAGVSGRPLGDGPVDTCLEAAWRRVLEVNLTGVFLTCKYLIPLFPVTGGSVVHIASDDALVGPKPPHDTHAYCASKGGILALTRAMAVSYAPRHIRVNAIAPGWIMTPMTHDLVDDPDTWADIISKHPIGRAGVPEDIAAAAVYLGSSEASFVTGIILPVEGGATVW